MPMIKTSCRSWVAVVLIAGPTFGGCADVDRLLLPPSDPDLAYFGVEERDGLTIVNFERSYASWFSYDANSFSVVGVTFDPLTAVYTTEKSYGTPWPGWYGIWRTPAPSGEWALSMGSWEDWTWSPSNNRTRTWSWRFAQPVSDVSFNLRPHGDFEVTCFDQAGAATDTRRVAGLRNVDGTLRISENEWYMQWLLYPLHHVQVQGGGISRCTVVSNGGVLDDLSFRKAPVSKVALTCSPATVTRGESVTCTASSPAIRWEVTGWKFVSSDGQEEVEPVDPAQQSSERWPGRMVRSGTVHVTATVSGETQTASAQVAVSDRNWAGRAPAYTFARIENGADSRLVLPNVIAWSSDLGGANWFASETPGSTVPDFTTEVSSGPNEGLDYFSEETTLRVFGYYVLNDAAMSRGSGFYAAQQQGGGSGGTQIGGVNWCPSSIVTGSLRGIVEAHEHLHGSTYERALARETGAALTRLERITASDVGVLYDEYDVVWNLVDGIARAESEAIHGQPGGLINPTNAGRPCALRNENGSILRAKP